MLRPTELVSLKLDGVVSGKAGKAGHKGRLAQDKMLPPVAAGKSLVCHFRGNVIWGLLEQQKAPNCAKPFTRL